MDGNLEKYLENTYDDNGFLLSQVQYGGRSAVKYFDARGESIYERIDTFVNTYTADEVNTVVEKLEVQKKLLKTWENNSSFVRPTSKLVSRTRRGRLNADIVYNFVDGEVFISGYYLPNDGVSDVEFVTEYNEKGDIVVDKTDRDVDGVFEQITRNNSYTYEDDENGNLNSRIKINKDGEVITTYYTWEEQEFSVR